MGTTNAQRTMTPQELQDHLRDTIDYVTKWRSLMQKTSGNIDGMPRGGGFESAMPYSDYAADMADAEIAAIGNLAKHTDIRADIGGRLCIPGFRFAHGRCVGMASEAQLLHIARQHGSSDMYWPIAIQLRTMRYNATLITTVAGVDEYLAECAKVRTRSIRQFKRMDDVWLTKAEVATKYDRSERTVRDWGDARAVTVLEDEHGERLYLQASVEAYLEMAAQSKREAGLATISNARAKRLMSTNLQLTMDERTA